MSQIIEKILQLRDEGLKHSGHFDYGANVLPVIKYFLAINDYEERKNFLDAIEEMLSSEDGEIRKYAVTLCLGFVIFRDAV
jgi:hypothetical protein